MTISNTLSSFTLSPYKKTPSFHSPSFISQNPQTLTPIKFTHHNHRQTLIIPKSTNNNNSIDGPDRLISSLCYFYPFFDGIQYDSMHIFKEQLIEEILTRHRAQGHRLHLEYSRKNRLKSTSALTDDIRSTEHKVTEQENVMNNK